MLRFLLGGANTGKTTELFRRIAAASEQPDARILLIVPEQFTFETEQTLFRALGGERFRHVNVTSFTRLATEIFKTYGGLAGTYAGECAKLVLMDRAVAQLADRLEVYQRSAKRKNFAVTMLDTVTELKNAGVQPADLAECADRLPEGFLRQKAQETALIYATYNALLLTTYLDPLDDLARAAGIVRSTTFFDGASVFLDEFKGFTATEFEFIRLMLTRAREVTVSLCLDPARAENCRTGPFSSVLEVYDRILRIARQDDVRVAAPVRLTETYFALPELAHLEQNVFEPVIRRYAPPAPAEEHPLPVSAVLCKNEYAEVDYTLSTIAALVQEEGYRYREIAIITRSLDTYLPRLEAAFPKYGIPFYSDRERPILHQPLIRLVKNLLDCLVHGFTGEGMLAWMKCGLTPFSVEEIAELENYIFVWDISGRQWQEEFTGNPRGFREELSESDRETLDRIDRLREYAWRNLSDVRSACRDASGTEICAAILRFLDAAEIRTTLEGVIEQLYAQGSFELAAEYARSWDILMEILDEIASASGGSATVSPEQFATYYALSVDAHGMGVLPQSLDCVTVGQADRIRIAGKRAVFILGVNENEFPHTPTGGGVFTDREREQLIRLEIDIAKPVKDKIREERFIAYKALCEATERLVLTARKADIAGNPMSPSVLFAELVKMFGDRVVLDAEELPGEYFCRSGDTAFSCLAAGCLDDTVLTATLKAVLPENGYAEKLDGLHRVLENRAFSIEDRRSAVRLFGRNLHISPSRVESFYRCRFRYFLEHGIRAFPLRKAELDPLETGTLIHRILFEVTRQIDLKAGYDRALVRRLIRQELDAYIASVMGGVRNKTNRFLYLYNRICLSVLKIVEQLHTELQQSRFEPVDFEYVIANGAEVTPLRLLGDPDENGARPEIFVSGTIDRVDCYTDAKGEKYIRIVDYKSGGKKFKLNDVLYGLNLQMLIYLHCITQNGTGKYANSLPAGILYMPAGDAVPSLPRDADAAAIEQKRIEHYAMNGLILSDPEIVSAMDESMEGIFIPVSTKKDGSFSKYSWNSLFTLNELGKINSYIDRLVVNMARELHGGRVEAVPIEKSCDHCNYRGVCGITRASEKKRYVEHDRDEIYTILSGTEEEAGKEACDDGEG